MSVSQNIEPLGDRVLILRDKADDVSKGGILIPNNSLEKPDKGKIICVGPRVSNVSNGDYVIFNAYAGSDVKGLDEEYLIMSESDLIAKVNQ